MTWGRRNRAGEFLSLTCQTAPEDYTFLRSLSLRKGVASDSSGEEGEERSIVWP